MKENACELCNKDAAVYCPSDSAFLCSTCDFKVHQANFLVARHIRHPVSCFTANSTADFHTPTTIYPPTTTTTTTTHEFDDSASFTSESSACISSTTSPGGGRNQGSNNNNNNSSSSINKRRKRRRSEKIEEVKFFMAEGILVNWCGKLGVREFDVVVRTACSVLRVCLDRGIVLPFRVFLVASMWLGSEKKSAHLLTRLEEVTGVPAKVILAAESKMSRALKGGKQQHNQRLELEEGWDESY